jgi:monothiol glutaredoxin
MPLSDSLRQELSSLVQQHHVVLFMKGSRRMPQCGFSAQVVQILEDLGATYEDVNVLASPELRDGIKEFSEWPTIPQLYVAGKFIGGCDIVREMSAAGELERLIGVEAPAVPVPTIRISERAAQAFRAALSEAEGDCLRLAIDARFQYDLFLGPRAAGDIEVESSGLTLLCDRASARRADGMSIDFVEGGAGGFKIENPNEPPKVRQIEAKELAARLEKGEITLFDVRPERERAIANIKAGRALDAAGQAHLMSLDRDAPIAFVCHHGVRSQAAAEQLLGEGFRNVYNLKGGIDAWSALVDPSVPRY